MTPTLQREDTAFLDFVEGLRTYAVRGMDQPVRDVWKRVSAEGKAPADVRQAEEAMDPQPPVRFRGYLQRRAQELMWGGIHSALKPHETELLARMEAFARQQTYGKIELDPSLEMPSWFQRVDFHIQPGAYHGDDMAAVVYDLAAKIYSLGTGAERKVAYMVANALPRKDYKRILDLGSGIAKSTIPLKVTFPEAEVWGVDLSAGMVKYGHMVAEEEKVAITFSQQDAEHLKFDDNSFDLVQGIILYHEVPPKSLTTIAREAYRVLRPGGHYVIADIPPWRDTDLFGQWVSNWQVRHNGEPYWKSTLTADIPGIFRSVGFSKVWEQCANPDAGEFKFPWIRVGEK